jgi:hypothetical protein
MNLEFCRNQNLTTDSADEPNFQTSWLGGEIRNNWQSPIDPVRKIRKSANKAMAHNHIDAFIIQLMSSGDTVPNYWH